MKKLPTDEIELRKLAQKLGVSTHGTVDSETGKTNVHELQSRIINARRSIREGRLWWIAVISSIVSVLSASAAWLIWSQQLDEARKAIRPEIVVADWQYSFEKTVGNLKSFTIVNVGHGPAMHIRAEMTGEPKTGVTFGVSSYHVPILPQSERKTLDFTSVIGFGDAPTLLHGIKFRYLLVIIACRDIDGHEYKILYKLMATNADYPEDTGFDKLIPGLYLVTRKVWS
jgi:hypothetical protein